MRYKNKSELTGSCKGGKSISGQGSSPVKSCRDMEKAPGWGGEHPLKVGFRLTRE